MVKNMTTPPLSYAVWEDEAIVFTTGEADDIGTRHKYGVMDTETKPEIVLDGVWQQFLPEELRGEVFPKALVGTRERVIEFAQASGIIDKAILDLWLPPPERHELYDRFDNRDGYL